MRYNLRNDARCIMKAGLVFIAVAAANCYGAERFEFTEPHMGTQARLVLYAENRDAAAKAARAAFYRIREIEGVLSDYKADSEIMKLVVANDAKPNEPRAISDDLVKVMTAALAVSKASDGAFDVTVGPLSQLWRAAKKSKTFPDAARLDAARAKVGWKHITLDAKAKTLTLAEPGMRLDFGGIGKGYAADEVLTLLKTMGVTSALVALSGDIAVGDAPPEKDGWTVEVAPLDPKDPPRKLKLVNAAVSTSGDLFQHIDIGGVRYSHVLDPATGLGLTGYRSATVVAKTATMADALAKVASVKDPKEALAIVKAFDAAAYIAMKLMIDSRTTITESKGFRKYMDR